MATARHNLQITFDKMVAATISFVSGKCSDADCSLMIGDCS